MLTIELNGARTMLDLLRQVHNGDIPDENELETCLVANKFFLDFYCQMGITPEKFAEALYRFNDPGYGPSVPQLAALVRGFRQAADEMDFIKARLNFLATVDPSTITERALTYLPSETPLNTVIHITADCVKSKLIFATFCPLIYMLVS